MRLLGRRGRPTPIRMVWWAGRESFAEPVAHSFGQVVSWWIDALQTGAWTYDPDAQRWSRDPQLMPVQREQSGLV